MPFFIIIVTILIFVVIGKFAPTITSSFGRRYAKKLNLSNEEIKHFDKLKIPAESFFYLDFCIDKLLQIYVQIIRQFPDLKKNEHRADAALSYCIRQLQFKFSYKIDKLLPVEDLTPALLPEVQTAIDAFINELKPCNEKQERKLNRVDATRWKAQFEQYKIESEKTKNNQHFYDRIVNLASFNDYQTTPRSIFWQSHQWMVEKDKILSCQLYLHYLSIKPKKDTFKYKNILIKHQKLLFKNEEQQKEFEEIVKLFLKNNNLEKALDATRELLTVKRKKIQLNQDAVLEAKKEHTIVVNILNEYLSDEEAPAIEIKTKENATPSDAQTDLLNFFESNDYKLNQKEVGIFAKENGFFISQLINNINEKFYEQLDDILIEETEDSFLMNKKYYLELKENGL